jgi:phosphoglycerate dehydrogenase-like enzyme
MQYIYVTEPTAIEADDLIRALEGSDYVTFEGNSAFTNSTVHDFETIVIRSGTTVTSAIRQSFPHLKSIVRVGVGLDNVDLDYCKNKGIAVFNAPGANADAVSDYTIGMMLHALRKLHLLHPQDVQQWNRFKFTGGNMANQTVGIVGFGNIGRQIHQKVRNFSCQGFYAYDPYLTADKMPEGVQLTDLPTLLRNCSLISLHLQLTNETKYLIDTEQLAMIKSGAVLINASRGGIVREQAVLDALEDQDFTYVADAVENEPDVNPDLLDNQNIIITPHIASLTDTSERAMVQTAVANFLAGKSVRL